QRGERTVHGPGQLRYPADRHHHGHQPGRRHQNRRRHGDMIPPPCRNIDSTNPLSSYLAGLFVMNERTGATDLNLVDFQSAAFSGASLPTWNLADPSVVFNGGPPLNSSLNSGTGLTFCQLPTSQTTLV